MNPTENRSPISLSKPIVSLMAIVAVAMVAVPLAGAIRQEPSEDPLDQLLAGVAKHLELSQEQRAELDEPMRELFELLPEVQRLHIEIALDLNEKQRGALADIVNAHVAARPVHGAHGGAAR